jgi:hypothetical protein
MVSLLGRAGGLQSVIRFKNPTQRCQGAPRRATISLCLADNKSQSLLKAIIKTIRNSLIFLLSL